MNVQHFTLFLHLLAVVLWVGGMLMVHVCVRPAAQGLPPAQRLPLMGAILGRFFPLVWGAIALLFATGLFRLLAVGFANAPLAWHLMLLLGMLMSGIFASIWFGPWRRMQPALAREDWAAAALALGVIRQRVSINLVLGLVTIAVATLGLALR